ncbi:MAG: zinc-ribbon domain-containing protein [Desulfobacterales bacterium]|nr:MAG: zinc-ribbon domain-containing protein [Desulfobacterales bacterium]
MKQITDIQCPACKTTFKVDATKIPEKGCRVSCKKCKKPFFVAKPPTPGDAPTPGAPRKVSYKPAVKPAKKTVPARQKPEQKAAPVKKAPAKKAVPVKPKPASIAPKPQPSAAGKKKSFMLIGGLAVLFLLICGGAVFFLMQKYNFKVTAKNDNRPAVNETIPDDTEPPEAVQTVVVTSPEPLSTTDNTDVSIGELFNRVNPAVATVITYDTGNNLFKQGSGFFINRQGDFITNYHVLKGAYSAVIKFHNDAEYKVDFVLAANEKKDLVKLAISVPGGILEPGAWLEIDPNPPRIADKVIVIGTPMGLGRTVSDGIISAIREVPERGTAFQMTAPISSGSSGSPVIDMNGKVIGVATFQLVTGQNLNFAIPADNILAMEDSEPLRVAAWTEKNSEDRNETLASLQKDIIKHIKHDKSDDKIDEGQPAQPTNEILKAKLAAEIIKESGVSKQTDSLTEMTLASFEEKYKEADTSKIPGFEEKIERFKDVIKLATNSQRMDDYIQKNIAASLTIPELEQVLKWYQSPLGKKIAEIEFSSYSEKKEHVNTLRLAFRLTQYQDTDRANIFSRLDEATSSTEAMVELQTNLVVQNQILGLVLSNPNEVDQAKIDEIIKNFETEIDPYLDMFAAQYVFAGFVYTYRGLTEPELEKYLSFSETEAGRKYYSVLKKKANTALLDSNKKILTSIIRVINEDSWVNIQKDLNKPIQET